MKAMRRALMGKWIKFHRVIMKDVRFKDGIKITSHPSRYIGSGYPQYGMIIGERYLPDGETRYGWSEGPGQFTRTGTTHALLVVPGPRKGPIYVSLDDAELYDGTPLRDIWREPTILNAKDLGGY